MLAKVEGPRGKDAISVDKLCIVIPQQWHIPAAEMKLTGPTSSLYYCTAFAIDENYFGYGNRTLSLAPCTISTTNYPSPAALPHPAHKATVCHLGEENC